MPLGFDEPFSIATKALCCALRVAPGEHIRISTRKRHGIEGRKSGSRPSLMSLLLRLVPPLDERCENLDREMGGAKAERPGLPPPARGGTPEFVGEDSATRRDGGLHRLDEDVDAAAIERRKPARLHQGPLSVNDIRVECGQGGPITHGVERVVEHRSKLEKWRDLGVALA